MISNCVLEHIPNLENTLKEIYRVLKPGGYFMTTVMTDKWEDYLIGGKILGNWYKNFMRNKQNHHNLFSEAKWKKEFKKTGFQIIEEKGYLSKKASHYMDLFHYISFPSLITYWLVGRWVLFPKLCNILRMDKLFKNITEDYQQLSNSSAIFYTLKKEI